MSQRGKWSCHSSRETDTTLGEGNLLVIVGVTVLERKECG